MSSVGKEYAEKLSCLPVSKSQCQNFPGEWGRSDAYLDGFTSASVSEDSQQSL